MPSSRSLSRRATMAALSAAVVVAAAGVGPGSAAAREAHIGIDAGGQTSPGVVPETAECFGPLSLFLTEVTLSILGGGAPTDTTMSVALEPGWQFVPGSCTANTGTCLILDPANLSWSGIVAPDAPAIIEFLQRVDSDVPAGTVLCGLVTAQFGTGEPIEARFCTATNSARQCGLGAPALGSSATAVLALLLLIGGTVLIRRRA